MYELVQTIELFMHCIICTLLSEENKSPKQVIFKSVHIISCFFHSRPSLLGQKEIIRIPVNIKTRVIFITVACHHFDMIIFASLY